MKGGSIPGVTALDRDTIISALNAEAHPELQQAVEEAGLCHT